MSRQVGRHPETLQGRRDCFISIFLFLATAITFMASVSESLPAANLFHHPQGYFTVPVPAGWQTKTEGPGTSLSRGSFYVTILTLENETNASGSADQITRQYAQQWRNFTPGPRGKFPLGNLEGGTFSLYQGVNPAGTQSKLEVASAADSSRSYVMLISGPLQAWTELDKEWKEIYYGFEVCGAAGSKCPSPAGASVVPATSQPGQSPSPAYCNRAVLGVQCREITPPDLGRDGLTTMQGAMVAQVLPGSPASQAGIRPGEVLIAANNQPIRNCPDMVQVMGKFAPGEVVGFSLLSQGRPKNLSIRLAGQPGAATFPPSATVPAVPSGRMPLTPPSRNLTQFQGNGFALSIPDNWTSSVSPSGRTTYLSAPDGRRKPSRDITTLLLGMIVGFETASVADLTTAADKQVRAFVAENPELRVLEHRAARLGGHAAEFIRMENPSPFPGEREISWMYMTLEGNRVCFLTFTSPLAEFPSVKMAFEQMVATFRFLDN